MMAMAVGFRRNILLGDSSASRYNPCWCMRGGVQEEVEALRQAVGVVQLT